MAMKYELTSDLMTGNSLIDAEHKQLFDAIRSLVSSYFIAIALSPLKIMIVRILFWRLGKVFLSCSAHPPEREHPKKRGLFFIDLPYFYIVQIF